MEEVATGLTTLALDMRSMGVITLRNGGFHVVALVQTVAYLGLEARSVEVQCQLAAGMPRFTVVGLPDKAVAEIRDRLQAALAAMGLSLPPKRIKYARLVAVTGEG